MLTHSTSRVSIRLLNGLCSPFLLRRYHGRQLHRPTPKCLPGRHNYHVKEGILHLPSHPSQPASFAPGNYSRMRLYPASRHVRRRNRDQPKRIQASRGCHSHVDVLENLCHSAGRVGEATGATGE